MARERRGRRANFAAEMFPNLWNDTINLAEILL